MGAVNKEISPLLTCQLYSYGDHYSMTCDWFIAHGWTLPEKQFVSEEGVVSYVNGEAAAATWIYETKTKICMIAFPVSNPSLSKIDRSDGIDFCIESAIERCKELGYEAAFCQVRAPKLIQRLQRNGFVTTDTGITHLIRRL